VLSKTKTLAPDQWPEKSVIEEAQQLCLVPDSITRSMTDHTKNPAQLSDRRRAVADMIKRLSEYLPGGSQQGEASP
jgi:hypothetical protein